ncbi:ATP-grasp domain-containing protein [soil metagenome]
MDRVLVVLPTNSYRTAAFVEAANRLGVELALASEEEPPLDLGDRFVRIDCSSPEASARSIVALADHTPIDAVVAADDAGVVIAALAAAKLGLSHHSPEGARATRDKLLLRSTLAQGEVPQPDFAPVERDPHPVADALGYPLILKPRGGTASRGVLRVDTPEELGPAFDRVRTIADQMGESGPLIAERYVDGDEFALEGMVSDGRLTVLAIFDKPDTPVGPTFEETLLITPSRLSPETLDEIERVVSSAVGALGMTNGPVHAEVKADSRGRVLLLEIAARSIGGLCGRSLRFGLMGTSLEELILASALGAHDPVFRQPQPSGVMMLPVPKTGTFRGVRGIEDALAIPGVTEVEITIPSGTTVEPLPEGDRYLGFIFATGATPSEVTHTLRAATALLEVEIE